MAEILRYAYDANSRLTNRWSVVKGNTGYGYDAAGNLTSVNYSASPDLTLQYDALNRLTNMVDAVGTTRYNYNEAGALLSEDGPWDGDTVNYTYATRLLKGVNVDQPNATVWKAAFGYDNAMRMTNVTSPAGVFGYEYSSGVGTATAASRLIQRLTLPNGSRMTNAFDSVARLTGVFLRNGSGGLLNQHAYTNNLAGQRTRQARVDGSFVDYTYDGMGQLITAKARESGGSINRLLEQLGYGYDAAGNLNKRTNNALVQTFNVNNLNELTTASRSGTVTASGTTSSGATSVTVNGTTASLYGDTTFAAQGLTLVDGNNTFTAIGQDALGRKDTNAVTVWLPASATFQYDANGNLLSDGRRGFVYDDENQLTSVTVANAWKTEFQYDGKMRLRVRKEYAWLSGAFTQTNEVRYVYDGMLVIQERNANNLLLATYTRGLDLSGSRQGAGGIGGLLARTDNGLWNGSGTDGAHTYYSADGNGNITCLLNSKQIVVGRYVYDPYGNTLSMSGPMAAVNSYRFSSKEYMGNAGLYAYGYRFYEPSLQRWLNRDPMEESGGVNLFAFVANNPVIWFDRFGLTPISYAPADPSASTIICSGGKLTIQNQNRDADRKCTGEHEYRHLQDWKAKYGDGICTGQKDGTTPVGGDGYAEFLRKSECRAFKAGKACREKLLSCPSATEKNRSEIQRGIDRDNQQLKEQNCD